MKKNPYLIKLLLTVVFTLLILTRNSHGDTLKSVVTDYTQRTNNKVMLLDKYFNDDINMLPCYRTAQDIASLNTCFDLSLNNANYDIRIDDNDVKWVHKVGDENLTKTILPANATSKSSKSYIYNVKYVSIDELLNSLSVYQDIQFKINKSSNQLIFLSENVEYKKILSLLKNIDKPMLNKQIKITVFNSTDDVVEDIGLQISKLGLDMNSEYSNINQFFDYSLQFQAYFSALKNNNKITINQSPTFLLQNGNKLSFKSVKNVPYLTQSSTTENTGSSTTNSYSYKDIGLQIELLPRISKESTLLDLSIKIEDLIDLNSDKPLTNRLEYTNTVSLLDKPILLTGLKKTINSKNVITVPLLSDIPLLGSIFKYKLNNNDTSNLSILIEVISNSKDSE